MPVAVEVFSFHSILEVAQGRLLSNPGVAIIIAALPPVRAPRNLELQTPHQSAERVLP
jgi:hypothetical protein